MTLRTHEVQNQPRPLPPINLFTSNPALVEAVSREGAAWAEAELKARGAELGSHELIDAGVQANKYPPTLKLFDRYGRRADEAEFHPAYHQLLSYVKRTGLDVGPWIDGRPGAHVARAAHFLMYSTVDNGTQCPTTMTYGCVPVVKREPTLAEHFLPKLLSRKYDQRFLPVSEKTGAMMGMGMTEKQGGSDVRANSTRAERQGDGSYRLIGHKWFFSAPMCDAFFVTAQEQEGLSCFFVPRFAPDGTVNELRIQRLKDKLGDKSNASSEVEFFGAYAMRVGEPGRGIPTILEMGTYTRLDCAVGTAGIMRACLVEAMHHARARMTFGKLLSDQPMMKNVLADLALEAEASMALTLRLARAFDRPEVESEAMLKRVLTPATKFHVCKRGPAFAAEAMEVLGGIGYVEENPMPRLYRQMPLNSIWEGSGNIMCLDVLRALGKYPQTAAALELELMPAVGRSKAYDRFVASLKTGLTEEGEGQARVLTQKLVLAVQASLLLRHAPPEIAETFCDTRLGGERGDAYGLLPAKAPVDAILQRAFPRA